MDRIDLAKTLNQYHLKGVGAEIGVELGLFSRTILNYWIGKLLLVDAWEHLDDYNCTLNLSDDEQELKYRIAEFNTKKYGQRADIRRGLSVDIAKQIADNSLDFIYIDAGHEYKDVISDLEAWYPKVREGGLISGHDYLDEQIGLNKFEVKKAVNNFVADGTVIHSTHEEYPSWFFKK